MTLELGLILIFIVLGLAVLPLKLGLWRHLSGRRSKIWDRDNGTVINREMGDTSPTGDSPLFSKLLWLLLET